MTLTKLIQELKDKYQVNTMRELMNILQELGLISDNCVEIQEVATRDLMISLNNNERKL
jgi:hypothetical protein